MKIKQTILKVFRRVIRPVLQLGLGRFYLVRKLHNFLISFLSPIEINGYKMFLEPSDGLDLLIRPVHEELETEIFKKEIKKGDTVLDIGAHIGYYTLLAAKFVGEEGKVFAFEPEPTNFFF